MLDATTRVDDALVYLRRLINMPTPRIEMLIQDLLESTFVPTISGLMT
jgi:hypothetical protein